MENLTAKDIMNTDLITVTDQMTVQDVATFLTEREILGAPVVDSSGEVVGVVSCTDIAQNATGGDRIRRPQNAPSSYYGLGGAGEITPGDLAELPIEDTVPVSEIMTPTVYTVPEDTSVPDIARTMVAGRIHRLLVTRGSRLVGIITTLDLLKILFRETQS